MRFLNKLLKLFLSLALIGLLTVALTYAYLRSELPSVEMLKDVELQTPMQIYSQDRLLISQYGEKKRIPLTFEQLPPLMIKAILDTEDSRFYQHPGIDLIGIFRAVFKMITTGSRKEGASTITMQVARNFFLTRQRTFSRKIKELFIALHIESVLSKNEILTLYLNKIELGHRAFGVGAAAQVYYDKDIADLTLAQIATIAGLPKAPSTLNPISRPERSIKRRAVVLGRMLAMGSITKAQYHNAKMQPVTAARHGIDIEAPAPYVAAMVNKEMIDRFGIEDAYTKGYNVFTTVTSKLQHAAQQAVINNLHSYDERHGYRGPVQYLWSQTEQPLTTQQISRHLQEVSAFGQLIGAVVTATTEQTAQVQLSQGARVNIDWENLKWARAFINDSKQGKQPKKVSDIFTPGAQVWLRQTTTGQYRLAQLPGPSGALVALDPANGAIRSIVGGYSHALSQYNRGSQAKRQVGSNIKPFIYSAALAHGLTLASLINDAPIHQWDEQLGVVWRPRNSPAVYDGPTRIRVALAKSKNVVSVRLLKGVGITEVISHIGKFGIPPSELPPNDSLALGSASLTPLQVASGISTFANGGFLVEPYLIDRIVDGNGKVIFQANPMVACQRCADNDELQIIPAPQVISPQNAFLISQAMTSTIWGGGDWGHKTGWNGTGWRAQKFKRRDLSGKTGTTNDARDTWFSGFSQKIMVTTWVGFDNPARALGRAAGISESGAITAQPAWNEFMATALGDIDELAPQTPEGIISVRIDQKTGLLTTKNDHTSRFEYFISGTEPVEYVTADATPQVIDNDGEGKVNSEEEIF